MLEHYHHHHILMVEGVGQNGMEGVGQNAHARVVEVEQSYWEEEVGLRDYAEVEEVGLVHYDAHHHEREEVEVLSVFQLQVVDWPSQFHHASLQSHK